ncbi:MAG: BON domain-containing protein [Chloroflexi bacterium]|nr:BON domain-containing protein [Chloroflexota bacterium]
MRMVWRRISRRRAVAVPSLLAAGVIGAGLAYLLDPDHGRRRRAIVRDRLTAAARRGARQSGRWGRYTASTVSGWSLKAARLGRVETEPVNDLTLSHRVESELFRDSRVPKGQINVNAEQGVIVLRGALDRPEQIRGVEERVRRVLGVVDVDNQLHLINTPAPNG